jgi:hypothetical protein
MDNFSLLRPKLPTLESPIIHRPTYPGMMRKMKNQNERNEWNARWQAQMIDWQIEREQLLYEAELLKLRAEGLIPMIRLAKSQIKREPPA